MHEDPAGEEADGALKHTISERFLTNLMGQEVGEKGGHLPVRMKNKKLINALYPTYSTALTRLPKLNLLIQYKIALAKTYPALAPAVQKLRHCQW